MAKDRRCSIVIQASSAVPVSSVEESQRGHRRGLCRDPLYLFACHLEWRHKGRLEAYQELVAALATFDGLFCGLLTAGTFRWPWLRISSISSKNSREVVKRSEIWEAC